MSGQHANLSPSSAERWMNCPGSVALSLTVPREKSSRAAAEGTFAHTLIEDLLKQKYSVEGLMKRIGEKVQGRDGFEFVIDDDMIDSAIEFYDLVMEDYAKIQAEGRPSTIRGQSEAKVKVLGTDGEVWGTSDYILYQKGNRLIVYDYKYGKGVVVEAEDNEQGGIYLLGVIDTVAGAAFDEVEFVIHQPRAGHVEGPVRRWVVSKEEMATFRKKVVDSVKATQDPKAPRIAGDWCLWCPAKAICPELHGAVQNQAKVEFQVVTPSIDAMPPVTQMPIDKLVAAYRWEGVINSWLEAVKVRMKGMLEAGEAVPGFKLVPGKSNRQWASEGEVVAQLEPVLGTDALYEPRKLKSPAQMEKLIGGKAKKGQQGRLEQMNLIVKPPAANRIAPDTDPRPAAPTSAAQDFGVIQDEKPQGVKDILALPPPEIEKKVLDSMVGELGLPVGKPGWPR